MDEITISKGSYSVTIHAISVEDRLSNKIFAITPPTGKSTQSVGPKANKIIDLLRITREFLITGVIVGTSSQTAKQVKDALYTIARGAEEDGGTISLTFDGDTINGYIEKLTTSYKSMDEPDSLNEDVVKYEVQINFMEGTSI